MTRRRIFVWSSVALALGALAWASKAAVVLKPGQVTQDEAIPANWREVWAR